MIYLYSAARDVSSGISSAAACDAVLTFLRLPSVIFRLTGPIICLTLHFPSHLGWSLRGVGIESQMVHQLKMSK